MSSNEQETNSMDKGPIDASDCRHLKRTPISANAAELLRDEIRFWQGVALSLAIFALSVLTSLVLGLGFLFLSR
jgi:hypothetical protein